MSSRADGEEGPPERSQQRAEGYGRTGQRVNGGVRGAGQAPEEVASKLGVHRMCRLWPWQRGVWGGLGRPVQEEGMSAKVSDQKVLLGL